MAREGGTSQPHLPNKEKQTETLRFLVVNYFYEYLLHEVSPFQQHPSSTKPFRFVRRHFGGSCPKRLCGCLQSCVIVVRRCHEHAVGG